MKAGKGVVGEFLTTRGVLKLVITGAVIIAAHHAAQKRAADAAKKDSLINSALGKLGYSGPGIAV
jgi:hypothetical protein